MQEFPTFKEKSGMQKRESTVLGFLLPWGSRHSACIRISYVSYFFARRQWNKRQARREHGA